MAVTTSPNGVRRVLSLVVLATALLAAVIPHARAQPQGVDLVRFPFPQEDGSLTPYTFELGYPLVTLVYDTLMWRDEESVPRPWLARAVETSPDGRRVTIKLAPDASWHDGVALTSADVTFTFSYVASHPHPRFTPQLSAIERVDMPDRSTVVIALRHPSPGFEDQPLAEMPILPAHLWNDLPAGQVEPRGLPVGSGPYRLVEHRPGELYRFQANDRYFRGPPAAKVLEVPIMPDAEQTLSALEQRRVDMVPVSLPEDAAQRFQGLGFRVVRGPSYVGTVLVFNLRRPPFDRVEVRRAVAKALDLRRITRVVGDAVPAEHGYLHPASTWAMSEPIHAVDEVGARAELARLQVPPIRVLVPDSDSVKLEAGRQVALALQRVGLQASHVPLPRHDYLRALGQTGQPPFFEAAVSVSPPLASHDPDFLRRLFGSDPGSAPFNLPGYRSMAFDALAERITVSPDVATRRIAVAETLRLLAEDAPVVPLFFSNGSYAFRPAIYDGWVFVKGSGVLDKRSFMNDGSRTGPRPIVPDPVGNRGFPYALLALGSLGMAATLAAVAISRRRN